LGATARYVYTPRPSARHSQYIAAVATVV
jgi:hypothetical protein